MQELEACIIYIKQYIIINYFSFIKVFKSSEIFLYTFDI
jgi:hypothetical protein